MRGVNKATILGSLGQDPEIRYTKDQKPVTNISVATSEHWIDKQSGERKERTEWHRVIFFDKLADIAGEYLHKGSKVYIEGKIQTRKWQDNNGQDRYTTEIHAKEMQMLDSREASQQSNQQQHNRQQSSPQRQDNQQQGGYQQQSNHPTPGDNFDDSIPF